MDGLCQASTVQYSLIERLRKCKDQDADVDRGTELAAILTHAALDQSPPYSLQDIAHALALSGASTDLDPLHTVPLLLELDDTGAEEILSLLSECGNARETLISIQESFEKLHLDLLSADDSAEANVFLRLRRLLSLSTGAIPRLKLRRRTTLETLKPLFAHLAPTIELSGGFLSKEESKSVIQLTCTLVSCAMAWAVQQGNELDVPGVKSLCRNVFSVGIVLSDCLGNNLAQQKFEACNPRLFQWVPQSIAPQNSSLPQGCFDTAVMLSYSVDTLLRDRSAGSLVLLSLFLSRSALPPVSSKSVLSDIYPVLVAALQSNSHIDDCLNILLHVLYPSNHEPVSDIEPDILALLVSSLAPLASTSPDPHIRLIAFRTLARLLACAPPLDRMVLLRDLLSESLFPSLRVAAVGLLKEAVLEALRADTRPNPFASPDMLRTFGFVVLRPDPPDLFVKPASRASFQAFLETQEPRRLVECLGFYYVLLVRDECNVTGIREPSQIKSVEREFLTPLKNALQAWSTVEDPLSVDEHAGMVIAALETSLERISEAYERLHLSLSP